MKKNQMLMTSGTIWKQMLLFAFPVFLGNLFQQLYNTADSLIVGNYLGSSSLAAVTSCGELIFLLTSLFQGISVGAGVVIARYFGANDKERMQNAIHTLMAFGLICRHILIVCGNWNLQRQPIRARLPCPAVASVILPIGVRLLQRWCAMDIVIPLPCTKSAVIQVRANTMQPVCPTGDMFSAIGVMRLDAAGGKIPQAQVVEWQAMQAIMTVWCKSPSIQLFFGLQSRK